MAIRVYNTLTRKKEELITLIKDTVKMYACGVTVYDACHIGHARQAIVYDVIRNYLKFSGYDVTYVRNYTDVDDKIIAKANEAKINAISYSNQKIEEAESDFRDLKISPADISPKVSENIDAIIDFIRGLIDKGYAYVTDKGDVYYSVKKFDGYGKLSNRNIEELEHGVRKEVEEGKEHPLDFVLWKSEKEGEVSWDSPWGKGRPGWHIECSAMSIKYLGETFDIHGGGKDLIFPHHENEIAQSEALTGKPFANYWVYNGLITVNGQKMSKSLKNYISIKELCEKYHAEVIRFALLSTHYSSDIDVTYELFDAAERRIYYIYRTLEKINKFIEVNTSDNGKCLNDKLIEDIEKNFIEAMDDDFNTALALSGFSGVFKYLNELLEKSKESLPDRAATIRLIVDKLKYVSKPLGLLNEAPEQLVNLIIEKYIKQKNINTDYIEELLDKRQKAKQEKDYKTADSIRNELDVLGITIQDKGNVTEWDIKELYVKL